MLNYREFKNKHASKYSNISEAEKRRRYEDYRATFEASLGGEARSGPGSSRARRARDDNLGLRPVRGRNSIKVSSKGRDWDLALQELREKRKRMNEEYIKSIMDPFAYKAHIPDANAYVSVPVQIKFTEVIYTDDQGNFAFFMRPSLTRCFASSAVDSTAAGGASPIGYSQLVPLSTSLGPNTEGNWYFQAQPNDNLIGTVVAADNLDFATYSNFQSIPSWDDVRSTGASYRVVSGGSHFNYVGKPLNASGSVTYAPWHHAFGVPAGPNKPVSPTSFSTFSFDSVASLEGACTSPAVDGLMIRFIPYGVKQAYRPTKQEHVFVNAATKPASDNDLAAYTYTDPSMCDIDPSTYDALFAPAATVVVGENDDEAAFYGMSTGYCTVSTYNDGGFYHENVGTIQDYTLPNDLTSLVVVGTGLEPSVEVYRIEMVLNVEIIPDARAFSAVSTQPELGEIAAVKATSGTMRSIASQIPAAAENSELHKAQTVNNVAKLIPEALHDASGASDMIQAAPGVIESNLSPIMKGVEDIAEGVGSVLDIAEMIGGVAELFA